MAFILDASVTLAWCFSEEATTNTKALLRRLISEKAFVPNIWTLEIGNILVTAERRKKISYADMTLFLEMLKNLDINIDHETVDRSFHEILGLAHSEGLTTYDAAYLELAMRKGLSLATKDQQLQKVSQRLGVQLLAV